MSLIKKIIALFLMTSSFSSTFATASDEEIEIANPEARQNPVYNYDLEEAKRHLALSNAHTNYLNISGGDLIEEDDLLGAYLTRFPETYLVLNLAKGDGILDENGIMHLTYKEIPDYVKYLKVTSTEDVTGAAFQTLFDCLGLVEVDFSELRGFEYIGAGTLKKCQKLENVFLPLTVKLINYVEDPKWKDIDFSFTYSGKNLKINNKIAKFYLYDFRDEYPEGFFSH